MSRLLLVLSFLSLIVLILGTAFMPHSEVLMMASGSSIYQYVREGLAAILFWQLVTHPPRHIVFRILSGGIAASVATWAIYVTFIGVMSPLDALSMLGAAAAIGVTSLEVRPKKESFNNTYSGSPLIA